MSSCHFRRHGLFIPVSRFPVVQLVAAFQETGQVQQLIMLIGSVAMSRTVPQNKLLSVKAALWAVGHIGSYELGVSLLDPAVYQDVVSIAESCEVLSLRG